MKMYIEELISKVKLLEEVLGYHANYSIMEPFDVDTYDILDVNKAARKVGDFLSLSHIEILVHYKKQEKTGGHINLSNLSCAVIEVTPDIKGSPETLLSILCHELTHLYLFTHNIYVGHSIAGIFENEIFTDIAGHYLGLGKLILNGNIMIKELGKEKKAIHYGYLTYDQMVFTYNLICSMRKITLKDRLGGLKESIKTYITENFNLLYKYFNLDYHDDDYHEEIIHDEIVFWEYMLSKIAELSDIQKELEELLFGNVNEIMNHKLHIYEDYHNKLKKMIEPNDIHNPCIKYLDKLIFNKMYYSFKKDSLELIDKVNQLETDLSIILTYIHKRSNKYKSLDQDKK
ncbi:MAG: hypothetical protein JEZ08_01165 [Clostridiales bacterium]|nr:hypothetical protein [Clostridiales bacterium]